MRRKGTRRTQNARTKHHASFLHLIFASIHAFVIADTFLYAHMYCLYARLHSKCLATGLYVHECQSRAVSLRTLSTSGLPLTTSPPTTLINQRTAAHSVDTALNRSQHCLSISGLPLTTLTQRIGRSQPMFALLVDNH